MDPLLLIADHDVRRRDELRRFFWNNRFLVAAVASGLECVTELVELEPDVLVIALEIPWGGGDGVIARLNELSIGRKPIVVVIGDAHAELLSARTGVAPSNCFAKPLRRWDLLDCIAMDLAARRRPDVAGGMGLSTETTPTFVGEGVQ